MSVPLPNCVTTIVTSATGRRLPFRCWHRGTQESDLIFGSFAESAAGGLSRAQLDRFEALLDCDGTDLFGRVTGHSKPPPAHDHDVMHMLRSPYLVTRRDKQAMERPLSPFMFPSWYHFQIGSALSILHRLTGIALSVGSILLA